MGDSSFTDPAANAPDAAAYEKGKGKATEQDPTAQEMSMDEDESSEESGPEELVWKNLPFILSRAQLHDLRFAPSSCLF